MTLEELMYQILNPVISVYSDVAPKNASLPYCTYQRFGGRPLEFFDKTLPDKENAIIQINCWAPSAVDASKLIKKVEKTLLANNVITASAITKPESVFIDDPEAEIRGRMQDFSIWYPSN